MVKVICGLGNPEPHYSLTRHNIGFEVVNRLVVKLGGGKSVGRLNFEYWSLPAGESRIYCIKPTTFMNLSGLAVADALEQFEALPESLFVISDDFHLPVGRLRIRKSGSSGGHKGLQSIIDQIAGTDFPRLRLGVGPLPEAAWENPDLRTNFVLGKFLPAEEEIVENMVSRAVEAIQVMVNESLERAITIYNNANPAPEI